METFFLYFTFAKSTTISPRVFGIMTVCVSSPSEYHRLRSRLVVEVDGHKQQAVAEIRGVEPQADRERLPGEIMIQEVQEVTSASDQLLCNTGTDTVHDAVLVGLIEIVTRGERYMSYFWSHEFTKET